MNSLHGNVCILPCIPRLAIWGTWFQNTDQILQEVTQVTPEITK